MKATENKEDGDQADSLNQDRASTAETDSGCLKLLPWMLVIALLWQGILFLGVPVGLAGIFLAYYCHKSDRVEVSANRIILIAIASSLLVAISLIGNYKDEQAPLHAMLLGTSAKPNQQGVSK